MEKDGPPAVIAIDGPAAAGKGTLARSLARHYGFAYLDTGLLYRAVAKALLDQSEAEPSVKSAVAAARRLEARALEGDGLRDGPVSALASKVAAMPDVRDELLSWQRDFCAAPSGDGGQAGTVLDGRDIGTVVCPEAAAKLFVTAGLDARARRRFLERRVRNPALTETVVRAELAERDARDAERDIAPMRPAAGAFLLDTTELTIEAAFDAARAFTDKALGL
ncbi:MAG: (d)CMP kinase [Pseudomonadota bacterium]